MSAESLPIGGRRPQLQKVKKHSAFGITPQKWAKKDPAEKSGAGGVSVVAFTCDIYTTLLKNNGLLRATLTKGLPATQAAWEAARGIEAVDEKDCVSSPARVSS